MDTKSSMLVCDVCQRAHHAQRLPFLCAVDARNALYEGRVSNARILMEKEELEIQVNKSLLGSDSDAVTKPSTRKTREYVDQCESSTQIAQERTAEIIAAADKLRDEVAMVKKEIEERKAAIAKRRSDLSSVSQGIEARRARELEEAKKAIKMTKYTWDREYGAMAMYRTALCAEVAKLYRLQRVKRGNPTRYEYKIGGIDIVDLHHLNSTQPELISASFAHIAHLLWLASHYLSIRLPAEITIPHNDYPRPTIFSLSSSYQHGHVAFPGSSPLPQDPRDNQYAHTPHPRPLYLDKPLATLAKDDPLAYNSFLEGACLLAYDIVWLCRTQGVPTGDNTGNFEDFSLMGRNLWNLLIGSSMLRGNQPLVAETGNSTAPNRTNNGNASISSGEVPADLSKFTPKMGTFSHGTAHTFLSSAVGQDFTRSFKLPNPIKLTDKLKARLVNEAPVPEWELIEDEEFGPNDLDDGVLVGATPQSTAQRFGLESYMSVNTVRSSGTTGSSRAPGGETSQRDKERSANGWTKVKPR